MTMSSTVIQGGERHDGLFSREIAMNMDGLDVALAREALTLNRLPGRGAKALPIQRTRAWILIAAPA